MAAVRGTRAHLDIDVYSAVVVEISLWGKSAKLQRQYLSLDLESQVRITRQKERRTILPANILEPSVFSKVWNVDDFASLERSVGSCGKGNQVAESPSTYTQTV